MLKLYSHWGFPELFSYNGEKKVLLCIDPPSSFFGSKLTKEREFYDVIILIHGCEPPLLNNIKKQIIDNKNKFDVIYSFDEDVLKICENSKRFNFGSCWTLTDKEKNKCEFENEYVNHCSIDQKKFKLSFIKSLKMQLPGHRFRFQVQDVLKKSYKFEKFNPSGIPFKFPLFEDSMFHISIENSQFTNYFTEKIIDCFMTYTVPIYWGCPNIDKYFNMDGIITFQTIDELENILNNLTEEDYHKRKRAILENYEISKKDYAFIYDRVNKYLNSL